MKQRPTKRRTGRLLRRLLLLAGSSILALICVEVVVTNYLLRVDGSYRGRPLPPYGAINTSWQRDLFARRRKIWAEGKAAQGPAVYDQELGWTIRASTKNKDGTATSNSIGARGSREYEPSPPIGIHRTLTFGDSFTYCYLVDDAHTWQARIEAMDPSKEVINFGIPSYGTGQALLRFRRHGRNLGAQTIILGLLLENIGRNVNRYRPLYFPQSGSLGAKPRFAIRSGRLKLLPLPYADEGALLDAIGAGKILTDMAAGEYWRDRPKMYLGTGLAIIRLAAGYLSYLQRRPATLWADERGEPYRVTLAILEAFHREAMAAGAKFAPILILPTQNDLASLLAGEDKYWRALLADLSAADIPFLDASDALREFCKAAHSETTAIFAGGHLSSTGNQVLAQTVMAWLQREAPPH